MINGESKQRYKNRSAISLYRGKFPFGLRFVLTATITHVLPPSQSLVPSVLPITVLQYGCIPREREETDRQTETDGQTDRDREMLEL